MAYQAVSTTLPKHVVVVLYIGFQFGTFYSQEYTLGYQNTDPKVEVRCLVASHYSPVGGHMGQLRRITTLQATVRLLGYPKLIGNCIYSLWQSKGNLVKHHWQ